MTVWPHQMFVGCNGVFVVCRPNERFSSFFSINRHCDVDEDLYENNMKARMWARGIFTQKLH